MRLAFIIVYSALVLSYLFVERMNRFKLRAVNKIVMAGLFLLFGYIAILTNPPVGGMGVLFLVSLTLAFIGDAWLLWSFSKGGTAFGLSNIGFFLYECILLHRGGVTIGQSWWAVFLFVIPLAAILYVLRQEPARSHIGKLYGPIVPYMTSITLHGTTGILLMIFFPHTPLFMLGLGSLLFEMSDYFLMVYKFVAHDKKWVLNLNSATYFVGMMLMVLSRYQVPAQFH